MPDTYAEFIAAARESQRKAREKTANMAPEEYAAFTGKMSYPAGQKTPERLGINPDGTVTSCCWCRKNPCACAKSQGESMSGPLNETGDHGIVTTNVLRVFGQSGANDLDRRKLEMFGELVGSLERRCRDCDCGVGTWGCDDCRLLARAKEVAFMSEPRQFTPGQTVWLKDGPEVRLEVVCQSGGTLWLRDKAKPGEAHVYNTEDFTTTDPNAKPTPQKCPCVCAGEVAIGRDAEGCFAWCPNCGMRGSKKPTREEAIAVWNSIRIGPASGLLECSTDIGPNIKTGETPFVEDDERLKGPAAESA
jgi:hypothetical protein